ncbi:hypothetical protein ACNAW0_21665 [Micromonospora sp. SL1-18]|uniref:hypothetical protein n=1 Tax=Micromonospora sp. SL1-18 TaxID=3399128 RepID=UPI003A4D4C17
MTADFLRCQAEALLACDCFETITLKTLRSCFGRYAQGKLEHVLGSVEALYDAVST